MLSLIVVVILCNCSSNNVARKKKEKKNKTYKAMTTFNNNDKKKNSVQKKFHFGHIPWSYMFVFCLYITWYILHPLFPPFFFYTSQKSTFSCSNSSVQRISMTFLINVPGMSDIIAVAVFTPYFHPLMLFSCFLFFSPLVI